MEKATILTVLGPRCSEKSLSPALETARKYDGHLAYLVVAMTPQIPNYGVGMLPYAAPVIPDSWHEDVQRTSADLNAKVTKIEQTLASQDISGDVETICTEPTALTDLIARRATLCDLALISNELRDEPLVFKNALLGLLFKSPVAVILNTPDDAATIMPKRIFVAWNTSLPSARAVSQALPMLKAAEQVVIATFDPVMSEMRDGENPGSDVAKWLSHHGCNVTLEQHPSGGKDIATCILERATEAGSQLIVAGAYGHSRLREVIFGGTTQSLVEQTQMPVLLAH